MGNSHKEMKAEATQIMLLEEAKAIMVKMDERTCANWEDEERQIRASHESMTWDRETYMDFFQDASHGYGMSEDQANALLDYLNLP